MRHINFILVCLSIVFIPVVMGSLIILVASGQQNISAQSPTPTIGELTQPTPNLQYLPQRAYIVPLPPSGQVQAIPIQEQQSSAIDSGSLTGILGILTAVGTGLWAKMTGSKEIKETNTAVLKSKDVQQELARVMFNFQPDQSKALSDAPLIKLENLEKEKQEFAEKVSKS